VFGKLAAITANTFTETIRQPIFGVMTWVAAFWLAVVAPGLASFSLESGSDVKILMDVSLSTMLLYGLLTSVFSATGVITREIESFTVMTVVSKPVARPVFLVGKYLGIAGAMVVGYYFLSLILVMTIRHGVMETAADKFDQPVLVLGGLALAVSLIVATFGNYTYGWHFSSTLLGWIVVLLTAAVVGAMFFDKQWNPQSPWSEFGPEGAFHGPQIFYAVLLTFEAVLVLSAVAVALATRFAQVVTLMLCAGVFLLGLLSDYFLGQNLDQGPLYQVLYAVVPNFQFFWIGDALTQELEVPLRQVALVSGYAGLYIAAVLALGVAIFQTREVG
jgi:ABC-2 type transport system permease protein